MNSTGRDRRGPNRQKQMGAGIQQVETDGDTYSTRERQKGTQPNRHPTCDMYPTSEDRHSSGGDRDRNPTREADGPQKEKASQ